MSKLVELLGMCVPESAEECMILAARFVEARQFDAALDIYHSLFNHCCNNNNNNNGNDSDYGKGDNIDCGKKRKNSALSNDKDDSDNHDCYEMEGLLYNIATVYHMKGEYMKADKYFRQLMQVNHNDHKINDDGDGNNDVSEKRKWPIEVYNNYLVNTIHLHLIAKGIEMISKTTRTRIEECEELLINMMKRRIESDLTSQFRIQVTRNNNNSSTNNELLRQRQLHEILISNLSLIRSLLYHHRSQ